MKFFRVLVLTIACPLVPACGPNVDDVTAACVEIGETRKMDGALRVRILRDLGVPADELQQTHSSLERKFSFGDGVYGCVEYLSAKFDSSGDLAFGRPESLGVLVAARDLSSGVRITKLDAKYAVIPRKIVPNGAYTHFDQIKNMVTDSAVARGELLMSSRLIEVDDDEANIETYENGRLEGDSTSSVGSANETRLIVVSVHEISGIDELLLRTDHVQPGKEYSLIAVNIEPGSRDRSIEILLPRAQILAVDQVPTAPASELVVIRSVAVKVSGSEAEQLERMRMEPGVRFSLR